MKRLKLNLTIQKQESSTSNENHLSASTDSSTLCNEADLFIKSKKKSKKRNRKNSEQIKFLIEEFDKNESWDRKIIQELAEKLDMKFAQIYKWHWEQTKKVKKKEKTWKSVDLTCKESLMPLTMEKELFIFQRQYKFQFSSRS
jgi:hypothetical protein